MAVLQLERPAKAYSCDACGSRDPHCKACAKAREAAEKLENKLAQDRKRARAYRAASRDAPVENIEESINEKQKRAFADDAEDRNGEVIEAILSTVTTMHPKTRTRLFEALREQFPEEGTEPTQVEILTDLSLLWSWASETTRERFLEKVR